MSATVIKLLVCTTICVLLMDASVFLAIWINDKLNDAVATLFAFLAVEFFLTGAAFLGIASTSEW